MQLFFEENTSKCPRGLDMRIKEELLRTCHHKNRFRIIFRHLTAR